MEQTIPATVRDRGVVLGEEGSDEAWVLTGAIADLSRNREGEHQGRSGTDTGAGPRTHPEIRQVIFS